MNTTKKKIIQLFFIPVLMTAIFTNYSCSTWRKRIAQSYTEKKAEHNAGKIICAMKCISSEATVKTEKAIQKNIQEALNGLKRNFLALSIQVSNAKTLEETIDEKHRSKKAAYQRLKNKLKGKLSVLSEELNEAETMLEDKIATSHGEIKTEYQHLYDKLKVQLEAFSSL